MDNFTKENLKELSDNREWPSVSIYMPMERAAGSQQNPIRFKTMVKKAENMLLDYGYKKGNNILESAEKLYNNLSFWIHRSDGLAMFLSRDIFQVFRLPSKFSELVVVTRRFHLKPLIPVISENTRFFILAVSQNRVRLLRCTRDFVEEISPEGLPTNIHDTLKYDHPQRQLQFHTGARGGGSGDRPAMFHGQGVGIDEHLDNLKRFVRDINKGVESALHDENAPLVFAGVDELLAIFRDVCGYKNFLDESLSGNPDELNAEELKNRIWPLVKPIFAKKEEDTRNRYRDLSHTTSATWELNEIVPASYFGRVDSLFVAKGVQEWGKFDPDKNHVVIHGEKEPEDEDLLDFCAVHTLANGGRVFVTDPSNVPGQGLAAAIFRY
jgi:hypothetical protein